ncbi:uncharacterized protein [Nicotiana sylvestris]|uniref:uncharacterized protein n=1 Tax=Nicotiana sylvestris TaxID=4096 RepID=UPI00388CB366
MDLARENKIVLEDEKANANQVSIIFGSFSLDELCSLKEMKNEELLVNNKAEDDQPDDDEVNIFPIRTVKELGIPMNKLSKSRVMIQGFNQGGQRAIGAIRLGITIKDMQSSAWLHVINAKTSYNVLLGMPWIHENKVVPSTYHQCLKYYEGKVEKKIVADDEPFTEAESHFADTKFYLKNRIVKEIKTDGGMKSKNDEPITKRAEDVSSCYHISFNDGDPQEDEDAKDAPPELEEGVKTTVDALKEVNLGTDEEPRPTYLSVFLQADEESTYIELLKEFRDVFAWSYKEMPLLDPKAGLGSLDRTEANKLIEASFIREVKFPTWVSSIVPVRKKNGQIRVCVDFRDLNYACPKDEFPLPIPKLMIDATTGYEAMSFMDGSLGYNQIRMAPKDEELTAFHTPKGIYCYKVMPFGLKNAGATYQWAMQNIFDDLLYKNVECYVDDLVVKSREKGDHLKDLRMVFELLRRYQLRMIH